ncbi:hypothetical protein N7450_008210 [Penicillium hetheringtonii]|uniref:Uncharacterized protein n=1 Tax=Penicillium hetheringtonii TaxID=911720 RepID=A0AAD6DFP7_9EURO|nr:hypothetical protein N7450_008210 [Penicillium hetheringtonii]
MYVFAIHTSPHAGDLRLIPLTKGLILAEQVLTLLSVIVASEEQTDSLNSKRLGTKPIGARSSSG